LGATLDSKIEQSTIAGKTIFNVAEGYLVACFDAEIDDTVVTAIAKMEPQYAVFRDSSMADDSTATNFEQIFKTYSPNTTTKVL
jgi:adenine-specific DNA-methyltransferase